MERELAARLGCGVQELIENVPAVQLNDIAGAIQAAAEHYRLAG